MSSVTKKLLAFILIGSIILLIVGIIKNTIKMRKGDQRLQEAYQKVDQLEKKQQILEHNVAQRNSPGYYEQQIRNKFHLVQPGEKMVLLPPQLQQKEEQDQLYVDQHQEQVVQQVPTWKEWVQLFL